MKLFVIGLASALNISRETTTFDCPDLDLGEVCEEICTNKFLDCLSACSSSSCNADCNRDFYACGDSCPCHTDCPAGCDGCDHPVCDPDFSTTTTSTTTTTSEAYDTDNLNVLVLNNYVANNYPVMVNFKGQVQDDLFFTQGRDTDVQYGCSTKFRGEFWLFGGRGATYKRQASKITGCQLVRERDLPFDFIMGACNTFQEGKETVFMCFGSSGYNQCQRWDGMKYEKTTNSNHFHYDTRLSIYKGEPFALGHMTGQGNQAETFNLTTREWEDKAAYPWADRIFYYATVSMSESVIVYGGWDGRNDLSRIAKFENDEWTHIGDLKQARHGHSAIHNGKTTLVIGGSGNFDTEMYHDNEDCTGSIHTPNLDYYSIWPELFLVDEDFCRDTYP